MEQKETKQKEITKLTYALDDINNILAALSTIPVCGKQAVQNMNYIYNTLTEQIICKE